MFYVNFWFTLNNPLEGMYKLNVYGYKAPNFQLPIIAHISIIGMRTCNIIRLVQLSARIDNKLLNTRLKIICN